MDKLLIHVQIFALLNSYDHRLTHVARPIKFNEGVSLDPPKFFLTSFIEIKIIHNLKSFK